MTTRKNRLFTCAALAFALVATSASAANYTIDWMSLAPTPFGSAPPFVGSYSLPGIGVVGMTYSAHPDFAEGRLQVPQLAAGSLNYGPDNYAWTNHETLARTNWAYSGAINSSWFVTYTFPSTVPAGSLVVGVQGLGRRNPNPNETVADALTEAIVLQNGTHFGDYTGAMNVGATQYTSGAGVFSMINSVTGAGGQDPWWNTGLAVVRVDDAVNSLTVRFSHTSGDGVGVNIGVISPEPASLALLAIGGLSTLRRRSR